MSLSGPFIQRPIATSLLMIAILFSGLLGYQFLPVSSLPEVDYPTIQVFTFYPGASPDVMTSSVTAPLERQFGQMPGLDQMTSASSNGASVVTLQFSLSMSLDIAEQEVQAAINAASGYLPVDLPNPPVYSKVNPADTPIITLGLSSPSMLLQQVEDYAETHLAQKISELPGVGLVSLSGGQRPAVRVQANPTALAAYGLSLEGVRSAIVTANVNAAKGSFDGPRLAYTINANDQLLTSAEYKTIIMAYKNNAPVRLSDIATVIDAPENVKQAAWVNKTPAVIMNIQRQPGANVIQVADSIKSLLQNLQPILQRAINVHVLADRTITIRASVLDVEYDLVFAIALVVLIIFLFLQNVTSTLIPSLVVPLSLIGTFGAMYLLGFSLNNLTLMALTIATGFVTDDAIVMIENIARYVEQGEPPLQAALKGAAQIGFTILSLTVSLIAVLIPLLFMSDIVGRLFREFAISLSVAILISAFISLTFTPMLCARLLKKHAIQERNRFERIALQMQENVIARYRRSLNVVLEHQSLVVILAIATLALTAVLLFLIPKGFFPLQDTGMIQGISEASPSVSFQAMSTRQQALANVILQDPAIANLTSFIGIDGTNMTQNTGRFLITLKPLNQRDATAAQVMHRLQQQVAPIVGIKLFMQPVQDITVDTRVSPNQYQYSITAPNMDDLTHWSNLFIAQLQSIPALTDVTSDQQNLGLKTIITIDRDTASRLGISAQLIDDTLYDAFGQRQVSIMFTQRNQYRVVLESLPSIQTAPTALEDIYLNSATGVSIPLRTLAQISQGVGPLIINRQNQFPVATLSFNLSPNASLGEAMDNIDQVKQALLLPDNVQASFEGATKIFQNALHNEGWLVLAAIIVVYIVLGILYESYIHPITILSTLPSAGMGALLAMFLTGTQLTVIALIGIILLIGIVMKNAILMIDFALEQEREYGRSPREAILEAAVLRFRPILMTTFAALFGAMPLALGMGMGSELRRPLGIAIIGGLLVSQLLTLYTTPVIYLVFDSMLRRMQTWRLPWIRSSVGSSE